MSYFEVQGMKVTKYLSLVLEKPDIFELCPQIALMNVSQ